MDARRAGDQRDPGPGDGRSPGGELRAPGHGHGAGTPRPRPVDPGHGLRRRGAGLARPRPVRALRRPRVDPPLLDALPDRSRPAARGPAAVPPVRERAHRATPSATTRRASRSPPAPWARAWPTASAWASPRSGCGPASAPTSATTTRSSSARDGDLEEGISHEAASLAGHLGLGRLVYVYDDNHISIDGPTELALSDDAAKRFEAYGWHVEDLGEVANDLDALEAGLRRAMAVEDAPSFLVLRSHIGYPSPKYTDTADAHGNPLGVDEIRVTKEILGLPPDEPFWVPDEVLDLYREAGRRGRSKREAWEKRLADRDDRERLRRLPGRPGPAGLGRGAAHLGGRREGRHPEGQRRLPERRARHRARPGRRRRRPHRQHRYPDQGRHRVRPPSTGTAARSTGASASTAWAGS